MPQQEDIKDILFKAVKGNIKIINRQDPLFGDTCLHAALDGDLSDALQIMVEVGRNKQFTFYINYKLI